MVIQKLNGGIFGLNNQSSASLAELRLAYDSMPPDQHLYKGEGERYRRYARLLISPKNNSLSVFQHDQFFQAKKYDVLYGDVDRSFAPLTTIELQNSFLQQLILDSYFSLPLEESDCGADYEVSLHMIRIQATPESSSGRPAPEGIHRDGYHYGSIHLMRRENLIGARNNIYNLEKELIDCDYLRAPMDSIYFDDAAIYHGVSPFQQSSPSKVATRDMLILLYQPLEESPQKDTKIHVELCKLKAG